MFGTYCFHSLSLCTYLHSAEDALIICHAMPHLLGQMIVRLRAEGWLLTKQELDGACCLCPCPLDYNYGTICSCLTAVVVDNGVKAVSFSVWLILGKPYFETPL